MFLDYLALMKLYTMHYHDCFSLFSILTTHNALKEHFIKNKMKFKDKNVLVTGASSGFGEAIAKRFAAEGANVAIVALHEEELKHVGKQISLMGSEPVVIVADLTRDEDVKKVINDTIKSMGSLDVLVNNAGIAGDTSILRNDMEFLDKVIATNFRSVVYLTHLAAPHLIRSKGNIVNISSIAGLKPVEGSTAYCCSKAAINMLTKCVASELGYKGVRVNSVNPGVAKTNLLREMKLSQKQLDEVWKRFIEFSPLGRLIETEEVADLVLFVASDKARGITGSSLVCDNGILVRT